MNDEFSYGADRHMSEIAVILWRNRHQAVPSPTVTLSYQKSSKFESFVFLNLIGYNDFQNLGMY
jgi:hypothetical protein